MALNTYSINSTGLCTSCGKESECKCDRCGDFYCSEDCQRKDWRTHRYICLPMPKLVKVQQCTNAVNGEISKLSQLNQYTGEDNNSSGTSNTLPNGSCVIITAFKSTNCCFVLSTNPTTLTEYQGVLKKINEVGKKSSALSDKPKIGTLVLALRNEKWCRGKILGFGGDSFRFVFIDFGDVANRSLKELRKIETSLLNLPCYLNKVELRGIKCLNYQRSLKFLAPFTNKEYRIEFLKPERNGVRVELFQWGSSISLNATIIDFVSKQIAQGSDSSSISNCKKFNETKASPERDNSNKIPTSLKKDINGKRLIPESIPIKTEEETKVGNGLHATTSENKRKPNVLSQIEKPCLEPPFETILLNETDESCTILVMDCSYIEDGYVGCLLNTHLENFSAIAKFLGEYNIDDQPYKPKFQEYCLANFENEWYRAKVVEVLSEDKFLVVYIDFSNEKELASASIRRYPMSLTLPCYTTVCAIDGLQEEISDEQKKFLEINCVPFRPLKIDSVRKERGICYVKCNELLTKMRNEKLL